MNELAMPTTVMSTRVIAQLTDKEHFNVLVDVRKMLTELKLDGLTFQAIYLDKANREQIEYKLPKRETLILVSGYSTVLWARIIDRLEALENLEAKQAPRLTQEPHPGIAAIDLIDKLAGSVGMSMKDKKSCLRLALKNIAPELAASPALLGSTKIQARKLTSLTQEARPYDFSKFSEGLTMTLSQLHHLTCSPIRVSLINARLVAVGVLFEKGKLR